MSTNQVPTGPALYGFAVFLGGRPPADLAERIAAAGLGATRIQTVGDRVAVLAVRRARCLSDAALAAEAELQDELGGRSWLLLCPSCDVPLATSGAVLVCAEHGVTTTNGELLVEAAAYRRRQLVRRPSRHRVRSTHKRDSLGAGWSKVLTSRAAAQHPALWVARAGDAVVSGTWPAADRAEVSGLHAQLLALLAREWDRSHTSCVDARPDEAAAA